MLVPQAHTVIISPSLGFSAATKKIWDSIWMRKRTEVRSRILPYIMQFSSSSPAAPRNAAISGRKSIAGRAMASPERAEAR